MNLADCYRLLELSSGASVAEVKASYRRLARRYHPDVNPTDRYAKEKFIAITEAYQVLLAVAPTVRIASEPSPAYKPPAKPSTPATPSPSPPPSPAPPPAATKVTRKEKPVTPEEKLSPTDRQLKWQSYEQLQLLLRSQKFPRAIALVEGLAQRLPNDPEVRQWQAIAYQRWGRYLVTQGELDKARSYLKKALKTDPHNKSLWYEVKRDFDRIEPLY
jgi:tetratricopeptide (TPR) repeat protein